MHAACWHNLDTTQFMSPRPSARGPQYTHGPQIFMPEVPPLPESSDDEFCPTVMALPV